MFRKIPAAVRVLLAAAAVVILSAVLTTVMHNSDTYRTGLWDDFSQSLVFARILQMQQDQQSPGAFLGSYTEMLGDSQNRYLFRENAPQQAQDYISYTHQTGLQGDAFGVLNKVLSLWQPEGEARERTFYWVNSFLFYAVTLCLCLGLYHEFGPLAALGWLAAGLFAPWVQRGMKDIYWCLWTWLLPALAGLVLCMATRRRHTTPGWAYWLVFGTVCLRCMCGFEFISTILILCEAPLFVCWVQALGCKGRARGWFRRMVRAGLAALGGVAVALAVWLIQNWLYFGDWSAALSSVAEAMLRHTAEGKISVSSMLDRYFTQGEALLQLGPLGLTPPVWLGVCGAAFLAAGAVILVRRRGLPAGYFGLLALFVLGLAAPVSWMVLAPAHCDPHPHLIPMLWNFAFAPAGAAAIGGLVHLAVRAPAGPRRSHKEVPDAGTP